MQTGDAKSKRDGGGAALKLFKANQFNDYDGAAATKQGAEDHFGADGWGISAKSRLAVCARLNEILT
jgi:hypothetical protein